MPASETLNIQEATVLPVVLTPLPDQAAGAAPETLETARTELNLQPGRGTAPIQVTEEHTGQQPETEIPEAHSEAGQEVHTVRYTLDTVITARQARQALYASRIIFNIDIF